MLRFPDDNSQAIFKATCCTKLGERRLDKHFTVVVVELSESLDRTVVSLKSALPIKMEKLFTCRNVTFRDN